ncbi:MAG: SapC family protein [Pseudomonadota bacterium]
MASPTVLDASDHRQLRVVTERGALYGENVHIVPVIADELQSLVLDYPVALIKDAETGHFGLYALLGFEPGENLYLSENQWRASYVPLHVRRQPFMVGLETDAGEQANPENAVITIDIDSKRVQANEGQALFTDDGRWSPYLEAVSKMLAKLMAGMKSTDAFIAHLAERDLLEPAQLNVTFADGEEKSYEGLYTVNDEKLSELDAGSLKELHDKGYLQACYLLLASIGHVQSLISLKNERLAAAG